MRKFLAALATTAFLMTMATPIDAEAHWHSPHRGWHHAWRVGPSYFPNYGFIDADPYGPICIWHRSWDAYWHRDCF